jgi:hypothetical protein
MEFGAVKDHGYVYMFYLNMFYETFKYGDGAKFLRLYWWCWNKHQTTVCRICNFVPCHILLQVKIHLLLRQEFRS